MKTLIYITALLVAGCAVRGPEVREGNDRTVVVDWVHSTQGSDGALALADQHCKKHGRTARYSGKPNVFQLAYDCVD